MDNNTRQENIMGFTTGIPTEEDVLQSDDYLFDMDNLTDTARNILYGVLTLMSFLSIFSNTLIILSMKHWDKLGRTMKLLLINIALCEIVISLVVLSNCFFYFAKNHSMYNCLVAMWFLMLASNTAESLLLMMAILGIINARNITRTITPANSVSYNERRRKVAKCVIAGIWSFWALIHLWGNLDNSHLPRKGACYFSRYDFYKVTYVLFNAWLMFLQIPCIVVAQIATVIIMKQKFREIDDALSAENPSDITFNRFDVVEKVTKLSLVISFAFTLTNMPYHIYIIIYNTSGGNPDLITRLGVPSFINALANIFIYMARSREFRFALRKLLCQQCW